MSQKSAAVGVPKVPAAKANDAMATLAADHNAATALYKQFETLCNAAGTEEDMAAVVRQICSQLSVHTRFEEDLFYLAVREAIENDLLLKEAEIEYAAARDLNAQLKQLASVDELSDTKGGIDSGTDAQIHDAVGALGAGTPSGSRRMRAIMGRMR